MHYAVCFSKTTLHSAGCSVIRTPRAYSTRRRRTTRLRPGRVSRGLRVATIGRSISTVRGRGGRKVGIRNLCCCIPACHCDATFSSTICLRAFCVCRAAPHAGPPRARYYRTFCPRACASLNVGSLPTFASARLDAWALRRANSADTPPAPGRGLGGAFLCCWLIIPLDSSFGDCCRAPAPLPPPARPGACLPARCSPIPAILVGMGSTYPHTLLVPPLPLSRPLPVCVTARADRYRGQRRPGHILSLPDWHMLRCLLPDHGALYSAPRHAAFPHTHFRIFTWQGNRHSRHARGNLSRAWHDATVLW